jgi:hypothetical protein
MCGSHLIRAAVKELEAGDLKDALAPEQQAVQHVQRAALSAFVVCHANDPHSDSLKRGHQEKQ